ncbi:hypothetical protein EW146_g4153 [Bondarzewia mesenterica]|uniref:Thioredoxin domain-containing protein n=1 Tax=Bondarzewia mesenterica TaxID=1095465 RepID=A0A4S4LXL1_9AGAM|nr:hypothetical protein EW146_g4153 [Bondarzewia mesenterica]
MSSSTKLLRTFRHAPTPFSPRLFSTSARRAVHYLNADKDIFDKVTSSSDRVAIVDFYADWCGPCRTLSPILERLTPDESNLDLVTINTDEQIHLAAQFKVSALPTVIAFKHGKPIKQFVGALPEPQVRKFFDSLN